MLADTDLLVRAAAVTWLSRACEGRMPPVPGTVISVLVTRLDERGSTPPQVIDMTRLEWQAAVLGSGEWPMRRVTAEEIIAHGAEIRRAAWRSLATLDPARAAAEAAARAGDVPSCMEAAEGLHYGDARVVPILVALTAHEDLAVRRIALYSLRKLVVGPRRWEKANIDAWFALVRLGHIEAVLAGDRPRYWVSVLVLKAAASAGRLAEVVSSLPQPDRAAIVRDTSGLDADITAALVSAGE